MAYTPPKSGAAHQFETGDSPTAGPSFAQPAFTDISGTATNSQLAGPLVNGVTIGAGGDFTLSKTDPLAVGNETLTPGNVSATHLSSPLPVAQGGTATASTLSGVVRGGNPMTAAELSGDATTSGSNAVSVVKVNGNTPGVAAVAHNFVTAIDSSARGTLAQPAFSDLSGNPTATQLGITTFLLKGSNAGDYSTASTTFVAVDTTNLRKAVTIPTGSKLQIDVSASLQNSTAGDGAILSVDDGGTQLASMTVTNGFSGASLTYTVTGDGASHTITLDFETTGAGTAVIKNSTFAGAILIPVMRLTLMPSN